MAQKSGPKLLTLVRRAIRLRHYSRHTEEAYVGWVRRFVRFCGTRHPRELGPAEVTRFLSSLAVDRRVSASTQNQALGALVFLYRDVLDAPVGWLAALVRARPRALRPQLKRDPLGRLAEECAQCARKCWSHSSEHPPQLSVTSPSP